ncbi:hypothetical protein KIM372_03880 [Bombiscardovia nodaiensis]|uniref:Type II toxin-antitoxin system HicB family antitoxin n=1 Tax=Bombiscardovia nodaiensis TaxID=2932181 RepID=A0ABM8B6L6_9BIFI|nr:hypothetical protein KIM372_03880 [Bombiscardovia nodaiensis]
MLQITLTYHQELSPVGTWWADSPDMPGFYAAGNTLEETRVQAIEGVQASRKVDRITDRVTVLELDEQGRPLVTAANAQRASFEYA